MKLSLTILAIFAAFLSQFSLAGTTPLDCRRVDYAELQQFNKKDLESKYCRDKSALDLALQFSLNAINAGREMRDIGDPKRAFAIFEENKYNIKVHSDCANEIQRTERILQQKKFKKPECK